MFYLIKYVLIFVTYLTLNALINNLPTLSSLICSATSCFTLTCIVWYVSMKVYNFSHVHIYGHVNALKKCVLVTGCDTGFGHLSAKRLSDLNFHVFAGCLDTSSPGALELAQVKNVTVLQLNVTQAEQVAAAVERVQTHCLASQSTLHAIVNNAGIAAAGLTEWGHLQSYRQVFKVNAEGIVRVTQAFTPLLCKSRGRIVNMGSLGGRGGFPFLMAYGMSKAAVSSYTQVLRKQMAPAGVNVIFIEPAAYRTPLMNFDFMSNMIATTWKQTEEQVQADYGPDLVAFNLKVIAFTDWACSIGLDVARNDPVEVVDIVEEAVAASHPQHSYVAIASFVWPITFVLLDILPSDLLDVSFFVQMKLFAFGVRFNKFIRVL